ncbi:MAG: hypothetical protein ABI618_03940 [Nitrospirota bacterium]
MSSHYQTSDLEPGERPSLEELYRVVYQDYWREKTKFRWFLDAPLFHAGATVASEGNAILAAQPYCDIPLHTPSGTILGTLFFDAATHPAHRRRGLFTNVVGLARATAFKRGSSIVMTTPNRISFQGFQKLPDWSRLCSLDCLLLPLGSGGRISGSGFLTLGVRMGSAALASLCTRLPRQRLESGQPFNVVSPWSPGGDADELWKTMAARGIIMAVRDQVFLRWRFDQDYRLFLARGTQGPTGYVATRVLAWKGIRIGLLLDCMNTGEGSSAKPLLAEAVGWLKRQGCTLAVGYFVQGSEPWRMIRDVGFLRVPLAVLPRDYPICVSVQPENPHCAELLNPARWHLSLADSDLV